MEKSSPHHGLYSSPHCGRCVLDFPNIKWKLPPALSSCMRGYNDEAGHTLDIQDAICEHQVVMNRRKPRAYTELRGELCCCQ